MQPLFGLLGGILIGVASAVLLVSHGRIAGISGIVGTLATTREDRGWRLAFVGGLIAAGVIATVASPGALGAPVRGVAGIAIAGFLVGLGTRLGGGCTSGHGICGLARGSTRSLVAVATFVATATVVATIAGAVS